MNSTEQPKTISVPLVLNTRRTANVKFEGPTNAQARKMAARRTAKLAESAAALAAGEDERAFDLDCEIWDIERDLTTYGFTLGGSPKR